MEDNELKLTSPRLIAYHVLPDSPQMQKDFLFVLVSLEAHSVHPLAKDVLRVAQINGIAPGGVSGFQEIPHQGLGGLVTMPGENRPRAVIAGSREFLSQSGLNIPDILEVTARLWEKETDHFIVLLGWDAWVRGVAQFSMLRVV